MSFREKSAWISFSLILIAAVVYFSIVAHLPFRQGGLERVGLIVTAALLMVGTVGLTVLEIVTHIIVAIRAPSDATKPPDERDRLVAAKANGLAFPLLLAIVFLTLGALLLGIGKWAVTQILVLAIVLAELSRFGAQIFYYRRGIRE